MMLHCETTIIQVRNPQWPPSLARGDSKPVVRPRRLRRS
jgi:hypothetical protein